MRGASQWTIPCCRLVQTRRLLSRMSRAVAQKGYGTPTPNFFEPRVASAKQGRGKLLFGEVAPSGGPGGIHGKAAFLLPSIAWLGWLGLASPVLAWYIYIYALGP